MKVSAQATDLEHILPWRDLYRQEMNCQIVHDSIHGRPGWAEQYFLQVDGAPVGYGSIAVGGPWKGKPTVFELYISQPHRAYAFELFESLLKTSRATKIEVQTNNTLLAVMIHTFAREIWCEKIVFEDKLTTAHAVSNVVFRRVGTEEGGQFPHQEPPAEWVLEMDGLIAASGGIMFHYNRPYGDIYMEVAEPFRRAG